MKRILMVLSLLMFIACSDKTDDKGFYTEGKNIGIHKETKTEYDKDGYDKDGFDNEKFGRDGWNKNKYINKETKTEYDKDGYNYYGFDKEGINRDTGTNYNTEGWDRYGFNEKGINKTTGFSFNSLGSPQQSSFYQTEILAEKLISKPYIFNIGMMYPPEKKYFSTRDDKFEGVNYIGRSYNYDFTLLALKAARTKTSMEIGVRTKKNSDYKKAAEANREVLEMIEGKFYIDIITNYSPDDKVNSYFTFTFFTPEKQYGSKSVELLIDDNILAIDNYSFDSNNMEMDYSFHIEKLPLYLNQVKIPVTDELFNLFAKMEKDKKIEVRVLNNEDNRFTWINQMEENKGLATGLGRHYRMKYPSESLKNKERKFRIL